MREEKKLILDLFENTKYEDEEYLSLNMRKKKLLLQLENIKQLEKQYERYDIATSYR